jgi:hypothetical protein
LRVQIYQKYSSSNPLFGIFEKYNFSHGCLCRNTSVYSGLWGRGNQPLGLPWRSV